METIRSTGRRQVPTWLVYVFAILLVGVTTKPAAANFKDDFKSGCQSGGHSFVENASDDSFACNLKSGGTIKCTDPDGKTPCTYTAKISRPTLFRGLETGRLEIVTARPSPRQEVAKPNP